MSAATSPGTGLAYEPPAGLAAWGFARLVLRHEIPAQAAAEHPASKRPGTEAPRIGRGSAVAIEPGLEASPWEGEIMALVRKVWAIGFGS